MHTFNNNCNAPDDEVSDTPPVAVSNNGDCEQTGPFCAGVTVINDENFMDYSDCPSMFTEGQRTRMFVALNSNVGYRNNLWSTANLFDVGCQSTISINENHANLKFDKKLIKTVGILGKESKIAKNKLLFYIYNDGTVEKKVILE